MPLMDGCCCYAELKKGSRASGVFSLVTAIINIIINLWIIVGIHKLDETLEHNEKLVYLPPGILVVMYIELACNICLIGLSFLLLVGVEQGYQGRKYSKPWVVLVASFRGFEILLGIYVVAWLGGGRISEIIFIMPEIILVIAYWVLDSIIMIAALLCVISYMQEVHDELFAKKKRFRSYARRYNVLSAAGKINTHGTNTPSHWLSRTTLFASQPSIHPGKS